MTRATYVGLDLSLTGAGVAVINGEASRQFGDAKYETATFRSSGSAKDNIQSRHGRIEGQAEKIISFILDTGETPRLVALEEMPYGASGAGTVERTGLWWYVVNGLMRQAFPLMLVNVSTVKIYGTGKGNKVDKDDVLVAALRRYPEAPISNNNEADAFLMAAMAARISGEPIEDALPQTHLRAMEKLSLP